MMNKVNIKIILSKFIALVLVSFPLGTLFYNVELEDQRLLSSMSQEEVLAHLSTRAIHSPFETIGFVFGFGLLVLIAVELFSFIIRKIFDLFTKANR